MSDLAAQLPFTGERFTPECVREIWYEHLHRYAFALGHSNGKRVLDAACGEGYGSALLAGNAHRVLGVDIAEDAVGHARARYGEHAKLEFLCCDVTALDALGNASFDLIVSFETLEHVHAQERMLAGFRRLLAPGGLLLISSPDKRTYSDLPGYVNEHHVRELYRDEFEALLRSEFEGVKLLAQKLLFQSVLWDPDQSGGRASATTLKLDGRFEPRLHYDALYYLALCTHARADLPDSVGAQHLFGDQVESVYAHYNQEIRRHIAAGHRLIAQEAELDHLRQRLAEAEAALASMQSQGRNP